MQNKQDLTKGYMPGMQKCPVGKTSYSENTNSNLIKKLDFLYGFLKFGEWNLILPCNSVFAGENCDQPLIADADVATAYGGVEKTIPHLTNRHQA